jgi:hypothetical protein
MDPESRKYTAFISELGCFIWLVMPMGLRNSCATFQRLMDKVLKDYIGVFVFVYLDDLIVFSQSVEEHRRHLYLIFLRLLEYKLSIKLPKCVFGVTKINFLGHVISEGVIEPDRNNVQSLSEKSKPQTIKQLQSFLGLANYYRKFIQNFALMAAPLSKMCGQDRIEWDEISDKAFDDLREVLTQEKVLALPNFDHEFELCTDACNTGIETVLQQTIDGITRPIAYYSKHLNATMQRYSTSEKELLAIVYAVEHFHYYLYGRRFLIWPIINH